MLLGNLLNLGIFGSKILGFFKLESGSTDFKYEQGNRRYQTSPMVCNRTVNSIYFLKL